MCRGRSAVAASPRGDARARYRAARVFRGPKRSACRIDRVRGCPQGLSDASLRSLPSAGAPRHANSVQAVERSPTRDGLRARRSLLIRRRALHQRRSDQVRARGQARRVTLVGRDLQVASDAAEISRRPALRRRRCLPRSDLRCRSARGRSPIGGGAATRYDPHRSWSWRQLCTGERTSPCRGFCAVERRRKTRHSAR